MVILEKKKVRIKSKKCQKKKQKKNIMETLTRLKKKKESLIKVLLSDVTKNITRTKGKKKKTRMPP
jgi:hypothetical protein